MPKKTKAELDSNTRDQVRSIEQTMREVVLPTLDRVDKAVTILAEKDYLTEDMANKLYPTIYEFQRLKDKTAPVLKGLAVVGTAVAVTLVGLVVNFIAQGGLK